MSKKNKTLNTVKLDRNIKITENLEEVLKTAIEQKQKKDGYWSNHDRLIDPVIVSVFYGLYKSRKLPPLNWDSVDAPINHEFNVNITSYTNIFNHLLFCLWLSENKMPDVSSDMNDFREKLYNFIEKILDPDFWRAVIIPFYVREADKAEETELSFLYKLRNAHTVKIESLSRSPEFLAMEFHLLQDEFFGDIITQVYTETFEPN